MKNNWFKRYLLPGLIFQSATIAGAYGSGQELAQFFSITDRWAACWKCWSQCLCSVLY